MKKICLTPVKNEEWILETFLQAASLWADIIIIADQNSSDKTQEIARSFSKVHYIQNQDVQYNEANRQALLLEEARKFGTDNFLLALDADEVLSANFLNSKEWERFFYEKPGTLMALQWANINPELNKYWRDYEHFPLGYLDDGKQKKGTVLHSPRIPIPDNAPIIKMEDIALLHLQFIYWERMQCKQIWYQVYERYNHPHKNLVDIYQQYNHYRYVQNKQVIIPNGWLYTQNNHQFSITFNQEASSFFWLQEIENMINEKGIAYFINLHIWDAPFMKNYLKATNINTNKLYTVALELYGGLSNRFYKRWLKVFLNELS